MRQTMHWAGRLLGSQGSQGSSTAARLTLAVDRDMQNLSCAVFKKKGAQIFSQQATQCWAPNSAVCMG